MMPTQTKRTFLVVAGMLASTSSVVVADSCLTDPVAISPNLVTSVFGKPRSLKEYNGQTKIHWGVDFHARTASGGRATIIADDDATVIGAGFWGSGYGNRVVLRRDNGDMLTYNHLHSVEPSLKSGSAVGFKSGTGGVAIGKTRVTKGQALGVAGGTSGEMDRDQLAVHLHLEYITGYRGVRVAETNGGKNNVRQRFMRNVLEYMCKSVPHASDAGAVTKPTSNHSASAGTSAASGDQVDVASSTQPTVSETERYGVPDAPPYESYAGMSETQIMDVEMTRRTLDLDWEENLIGLGLRGLWMEITRIDGALAWFDRRIEEKRSQIEAELSALLSKQALDFFVPRVQAANFAAEKESIVRRVY